MPLLIFFKNFLKWLILMTVIISMSSNSWFIYWLMMEINLMMFIPIMTSKKKNSINCMITYFVIQSFSSSLFLIMMMYYSIMDLMIFNLFVVISLMIKLGMMPFHFWLTNLSEMFDFDSLFFILTIQKLIPLFISSMLNTKILIIFAMISSIFSSLFMYNLKNFKKIILFSSISHLGWIVTLIYTKSNFWISYMIIYSILILKVLMFLKKNNTFNINTLFMTNKPNLNKISFCMLMLSLGGMPPFIGFFMKFISILIIIKFSNLIILILIISSMINIFIYLRMLSPYLFIFFKNTKKIFVLNFDIKYMILNINLMITIFFINLLII